MATISERNLVSQNPIKLTIHPAELFADNNGGIKSVACSTKYIVAIGVRQNEIPVMKVYNSAYKLVSEKNQIPLGVFNGSVLRQLGSGLPFVETGAIVPTAWQKTMYQVAQIEFASIINSLRAVHIIGASSRLYAAGLDNSLETIFLNNGCEVYGEPQGRYLVFSSDTTVRVVDTNKADSALGLNGWDVELFDRSKLSGDVINRYPFLQAHAITPLGVPMADLNRSISFDGGTLSLVDLTTGGRLYTEAADGYSVDPKDNTKIFYVDSQSRTINILDAASAKPGISTVDSKHIPFAGDITDLKFDPAGNYLICTVVDEQKESLKIISRDTFEILAQQDGVRGPLTMDSAGSMYFIDQEQKLRLITTNLASLDPQALTQKREELAQQQAAELARLDALELPDAPPQNGAAYTGMTAQESFITEAKTRIQQRLGTDIAKANDLDSVTALVHKIEVLKAAPDMKQFAEAFEDVEQELRVRQNGFLLDKLKEDVTQFISSLPEVLSPASLKDIEDSFRELKLLRLQVQISSLEVRREMDHMIADAQAKKDLLITDFAQVAATALEKLLQQLDQSIGFCSSVPELQTLLISDEAKDFDATVAVLPDTESRKEWKDKLKSAVSERKAELQDQEQNNQRLEQERLEEVIDGAQEILRELAEDLAQADATTISMARSAHPLAIRFREQIAVLPKEIREAAQNQLQSVIEANRRKSKSSSSASKIISTGADVQFGNQTFSVFPEYGKFSNPKLVPISGKQSTYSLVFQDTIGRTYDTGEAFSSKNPNSDEVKEAIARLRSEANHYFENLPRSIPQYQDSWIMAPSVEKYLETMCRRFNSQLKRGRGLLVLEGEAGTGKNVLVDMFCYFANRETMTFACNFQTEKEDLTYAFRFDKEKGTYQVDAKLIEMMQTPGAVILFDEINTLPPGVLKMLNSLFDYRRTLFLPDGRVIKAESSVIFVAAMNPRHYLGVKELSKEMVSRGQFMSVEYPPLNRTDGSFAPDEALMVSHEVDELADMTMDQFITLWDEVVNNKSDQVAGFTYDQVVQVQSLHKIVKMADAVRKAYVAHRTGQSHEIIDLVYSLRETSDIASELTAGANVLEIALDIVLPKISDISQREAVELLMRNAI